MIFRAAVSISIISLCIGSAYAQDFDSVDQVLTDLGNDAVVMNLAAHPDDEDAAGLTYNRIALGARTHSIVFTRGEGGQNAIGPELYEELGVIRTEETQQAAKVIGSRVDFLNFQDFGFSKSASETFSKWGGKDEVVRRLVYIIRKYRPDVLFMNHTTGRAHGHHQAVAVAAIDAFDAAADPSRYPEQLSLPGIGVWQTKKLFVRVFPLGDSHDVTLPVNDVNEHEGISYLLIAQKGLRLHHSQGLDSVSLTSRGLGSNRYLVERTFSSYGTDSTTFFSGLTYLAAPEDSLLRKLRSSIDSLISNHSRAGMMNTSLRLAARVTSVDTSGLSAQSRRILDDWNSELDRLVRRLSGMTVAWSTSDPVTVSGEPVGIRLSVSGTGHRIRLVGLSASPAEGWRVESSELHGDGSGAEIRMVAGAGAPRTVPKVRYQYNPIETGTSTILFLEVSIDGSSVILREPVRIDLAPDQELILDAPRQWALPAGGNRNLRLEYHVINHRPDGIRGSLHANLPRGWTAEDSGFSVDTEDGTGAGTVILNLPDVVAAGDYDLRFSDGPMEAKATVRVFDVQVSAGVHLGIIKSYDDALETVAAGLSVPYEMVSVGDLSVGNLGRFSSIVVDIRSYAAREDLRASNQRLLEYVKNGGTLVVFYHKQDEWKPEYAPYPFSISRDRVTVEEAPVTILLPDHWTMNTPNRIGPDDWNGWVQERGLNFPAEVPAEYERVLSTHDPDEPPLDTGLIVSGYGAGSYLYTSYVWYRQMKELNPGAIRCFANFISHRPALNEK